MHFAIIRTRFTDMAFALLLTEFENIPLERLPEALEDLKFELVTAGVGTLEEVLEMVQQIQFLCYKKQHPQKALEIDQKMQALLFKRQYPPEVLMRIQEMRVHEAENTSSH